MTYRNSSKPKSSHRKTKSKSKSKTQKKKLSSRSKCVNAHIISDESSSESSSSENDNTISSENELETNTLACSWNGLGSSSSETSESIDSFTRTQPKEVSINGYNMINAEFIVLKDPVLNYFTSNFSDKEREKFWHKFTMVFSHILQPISDLIRIASQQANTLFQKAPEEMQPEAEISWPNPIEINFFHAPVGFSPDFSLSSEDNFLQSKSLDDESEIQDFTSSPNHCEA
ncbi:hypothetical protein F8M41_020761 [Gigaspora margarita]|uniref:Uncharacterized protein n=1 Tax=Gigaspora margarita TaxID=4874 RepID=A0A8H4EJH2_GIGMA|nr:hypothetical protein F8M41_020761 [Gigaspora margarita]